MVIIKYLLRFEYQLDFYRASYLENIHKFYYHNKLDMDHPPLKMKILDYLFLLLKLILQIMIHFLLRIEQFYQLFLKLY
jgi:hypothetical protein